jgi:molybdate transport system ATP-binding protein
MLFTFTDASFKSGGKLVLEHTSWSVRKGEHWAVVGPTGAGKTLLARALCREIPLIHGEVHYYFNPEDFPDGRPFPRSGEVLVFSAETHREFLRRYSDYTQARFESVEGEGPPTVSSILRPEPGRKAKRGLRARLLNFLGLNELLQRPVHLLSHGESRKVFLARLLLRSPRLVLLDDPYVGLDRQTRVNLGAALEGMLQAGDPQIILLTSRPDEIPVEVKRFLWLEDCRVRGEVSREKAVNLLVEKGEGVVRRAAREEFVLAAARYEADLGLTKQVRGYGEIIAMQDVSVVYDGTRILNRIDWSVRAGERWALLGPNGAGKTTLLSLVLGDHPQAYANDITLFGRRRGSGESIWEIKARQGWVSPELQIHFPRAMSCLDVVCSGYYDSIGLFRHTSPEQLLRARGWLLALGAAEPGSSFGNLSAGEQRVVLLARALVKHPPLLVLDEPLQGLDLPYRREILALVDRMCAHSALSLIYVSHYSDELPRAITHRLLLEKGQVLENGAISKESG